MFTGEIFFTGKVETIDGESYIKSCDSIKVKEDLIKHVADEDEEGGDENTMYEDLFDSGNEFNYEMCNS